MLYLTAVRAWFQRLQPPDRESYGFGGDNVLKEMASACVSVDLTEDEEASGDFSRAFKELDAILDVRSVEYGDLVLSGR